MPKSLTVQCLLSRNAENPCTAECILIFIRETLLKELEKLAAIFKNYFKKRQFYKVNSYLQIWLISKTCQGRNYIHRNSCSLAMKASSTCSYAVTLRRLSLVHRCCQ